MRDWGPSGDVVDRPVAVTIVNVPALWDYSLVVVY